MSDLESKVYTETFYIVPRYIRHLPGITLAYLDVYETIFQFWNKNLTCFLGEESLCERTNYKRAIVYRALTFFEKHNELKRIKRNGKRYLIQPEKIIETDCTKNEPTSTNVDPNVYNRRLSTSTTVDHNIKKGNKETKNIPDSTKSGKNKSVKDYERDERFMRFYNAYPKRVDPRDAWKAFKSIVGNDDILLEEILKDIEERRANHSQWQDKQFIKYPAVYLRKGEYLGEIHNKAQEIQEKERVKKEANAKRLAEQEAISKKRMEYEMEKQQRIQQDGKAYRNIASKVAADDKNKPHISLKERIKNFKPME